MPRSAQARAKFAETSPRTEAQNATFAVAQALAHEINNPLAAAWLQLSALDRQGLETGELTEVLRRIQMVGAELALAQAQSSESSHQISLDRALALVLSALNSCNDRVQVQIEPVQLLGSTLGVCRLFHAVLIAHLEADSNQRLTIRAKREGRRVRCTVSGGRPSHRMRTSILGALLGEPEPLCTGQPLELAIRRAATLGVACKVRDIAGSLETELLLPIALESGVMPSQKAYSPVMIDRPI